MEKLNWGIIGLGRVAESFSQGFLDVKNAKLLSVASNDITKLEKYKKIYNLEEKYLFKNYEELINCKDVDIIYVALPNSLHHYWVLKVIEQNKNVLVEKPATISLLEAESIYNKIAGKNLFFGEAFMYRYLPQTKLVIQMIRNQEIGEIFSMDSSFGINILTKKNFLFFNKKKNINVNDRKFNKELGGGSIYDLGCYPTSFSLLINSLLNKKKVNNFNISNVSREIGETGVDINSSAKLLFENGFSSKVYSSFKKNLGCQSIIKGQKGKIILQDTWRGKNIIIQPNNKREKEIYFDNKKNAYSYQIEIISNNIINGLNKVEFPGMNIEETIQNTKILEIWLNR